MAAVLAHEIKNPLAGIRGAAQLIEEALPEKERELTQLICAETDRISALIDRMESFGDTRAFPRAPVNIHEVLDRVHRVAETSFAKNVTFVEDVRSFAAASAGRPRSADPGVHEFGAQCRRCAAGKRRRDYVDDRISPRRALRRKGGGRARCSLPLEITVRDNGYGRAVRSDAVHFRSLRHHKARGSGLGLALVAKIVGDHGGVIECEFRSTPHSFPHPAAKSRKRQRRNRMPEGTILSPTTIPPSVRC